MSWVRLADGFFAHPTTLQAGLEANGLYGRALSYCAAGGTGEVPDDWIDAQGASRTAIERLITLGLFERRPGCVFVPGVRVIADREARKRDAPGRHTPEQLQQRIEFYGGVCWICRTAPADTIDHVKPLAAGGSNWPANLRPACKPCNSRKHARWPYERPTV